MVLPLALAVVLELEFLLLLVGSSGGPQVDGNAYDNVDDDDQQETYGELHRVPHLGRQTISVVVVAVLNQLITNGCSFRPSVLPSVRPSNF
jgi:hypothetical protein